MPNRKVRVSYGRTVQSAPYESIRLDVAIERDVNDDEKMMDVIDKLENSLVIHVKTKIAKILDNE